jgi:ADP-ribosylglycohydrolase
MLDTPAGRLGRALVSLDGLSVGDAFGERFFGEPRDALRRIRERELSKPPWKYTDDAEMALSVVEVLKACSHIDQDALATAFARRMSPERGYGQGAYGILTALRKGLPWRPLSYAAMGGVGSFGNGAAMRVAPLGAYFADDLSTVVAQARLSAEVTHAHAEGIAGAIAVAVAAALTWRNRRERVDAVDFIKAILEHVPAGFTRDAIEEVLRVPIDARPLVAAGSLGSGSGVTAPDTVPFCLWAVARGETFEESLWTTVEGMGDRDTTCAIVGGIVGLRSGREGIPPVWLSAREKLPQV